MLDLLPLLSVFLVGIVASFIGSIAGNGGLISIPFLIFLGLPPHVAIATNKMGAVGMGIGSISKFWKAKKIVWKYVPFFSVISLIGAYIGANMLLSVNEEVLNKIIGGILILLIPMLFMKKDFGIKTKDIGKTKKIFGYILYFCIMIFGGFFGGGAGSLILSTLMIFFGLTILEANATNHIPWLLLSAFSLIIFCINGIVNYEMGTALFLGMLIGGYLGTHTALKNGDQWVKVVFGIVVVVSGIKLLLF